MPGLLSGTATWDKVQSFKNDVRNFAFSSDGTAYAWGESRLLTVPRTLVRWGGTTNPETVNRDLDDEDPESSGVYGGTASALHWVSLDMERTQMLIANRPSVVAVTVSNDGAYYLAAQPSKNAELWKMPFE